MLSDLSHRSVAVAVAAAVGIGATTAYVYTRLRRTNKECAPRNPLTRCTAARGQANILILEAVDRVDRPGGKSKQTPPGRDASHYLTASHQTEVNFEELFAPESPYVLYSVERVNSDEPFLVFLALAPDARRKMWLEEAFIDRGIRKLVELGSHVALASLATAQDYVADRAAQLATGEWQISFVWNTGRCGSTLMHKAVSAMGTASFSEPHWLDQLKFQQLDEERMVPALRVCVAIEALTARLQTAVPGWKRPTNFVFNPKSGGMRLAEATVTAFPLARHAFMYRACHSVVESFAGLMFTEGVPFAMSLSWRFLGVRALDHLGTLPSDDLPFRELSSLPVAMLTLRWIRTIEDWIATTSRRAEALGANDPLASSLVLRMDEFTSKDLELRAQIMSAALVHFRIIDEGASRADIARALDVFSVHSQAGSAMSGPKAKVVTEGDVGVIKRCVAGALAQRAHVQDSGANIVLDRSLGVAVSLQ